jgi:hypothetical protein
MSAFQIKQSKYKGIKKVRMNGKTDIWIAQTWINGYYWKKHFKTEYEAAKGYDLKMIELNKKPVNILHTQITSNKAQI